MAQPSRTFTGIIGFSAAAEAMREHRVASRTSPLRGSATAPARSLAAATAVDDVTVLGGPVRGPTSSGVRWPRRQRRGRGQLLLGLDQAGIGVHSGSACSSESFAPSPVLAAMGADAERSLRMSVGWSTTDDDVAAFTTTFAGVVSRLRSRAGLKPR